MKILISAMVLISALAILSFKGEKIKGNGNVTTQSREVSGFDKIASAGSIDVVISQGNKEGITVVTDENIQSAIITEVKNNTLSIHVKENTDITPTRLEIKVNCRNLNAISAGGSGDISTEGALKSDELEISQGGSGDFKLEVNVDKLEISMAGSGDFDIKGTAGNLEISSAGSGNVNARNLKAEAAEVSMAGSGDITLSKNVKAKVSSVGSGVVHQE